MAAYMPRRARTWFVLFRLLSPNPAMSTVTMVRCAVVSVIVSGLRVIGLVIRDCVIRESCCGPVRLLVLGA
jgi:hypothetical protein